MASSISVLAARRLRRQVKQLTAQLDGLRAADDLEYVHRARVASRRLRTVLRVFESRMPAAKVSRWRNAIRRVGRGLGDARDKDVQIAYLEEALRGLSNPAHVPGVARVLAQWEKRREELQPAVVRAARKLRAGGVLTEMLAFARRRIPSGKGKKIVPDEPLYRHAEREIVGRADVLRALEDCLVDPGDSQQHHKMRIAAKRLRYALELFKGVYAGRVDAILESLKQLQALLGDVHDCDVWVEQLDAFLRKHGRRLEACYQHTGRLARWQAGVEHLQEDRRQRRRQQFDTAVQFWQGLCGAGLWDNLLSIVRTREPAAASAEAAEPKVVEAEPASTGFSVDPHSGNGKPASTPIEDDTPADDAPAGGNGRRRPGRTRPAWKPAPLAVGPAEVGG
jgi:CHAD domain-containing protein